MVIELLASQDLTWKGWRPEVDDARIFKQDCVLIDEAKTNLESLRTKFADLPAFGLWKNRKESDDELLEEFGSGWRGFAAE